jgi:hypothetical protein
MIIDTEKVKAKKKIFMDALVQQLAIFREETGAEIESISLEWLTYTNSASNESTRTLKCAEITLRNPF